MGVSVAVGNIKTGRNIRFPAVSDSAITATDSTHLPHAIDSEIEIISAELLLMGGLLDLTRIFPEYPYFVSREVALYSRVSYKSTLDLIRGMDNTSVAAELFLNQISSKDVLTQIRALVEVPLPALEEAFDFEFVDNFEFNKRILIENLDEILAYVDDDLIDFELTEIEDETISAVETRFRTIVGIFLSEGKESRVGKIADALLNDRDVVDRNRDSKRVGLSQRTDQAGIPYIFADISGIPYQLQATKATYEQVEFAVLELEGLLEILERLKNGGLTDSDIEFLFGLQPTPKPEEDVLKNFLELLKDGPLLEKRIIKNAISQSMTPSEADIEKIRALNLEGSDDAARELEKLKRYYEEPPTLIHLDPKVTQGLVDGNSQIDIDKFTSQIESSIEYFQGIIDGININALPEPVNLEAIIKARPKPEQRIAGSTSAKSGSSKTPTQSTAPSDPGIGIEADTIDPTTQEGYIFPAPPKMPRSKSRLPGPDTPAPKPASVSKPAPVPETIEDPVPTTSVESEQSEPAKPVKKKPIRRLSPKKEARKAAIAAKKADSKQPPAPQIPAPDIEPEITVTPVIASMQQQPDHLVADYIYVTPDATEPIDPSNFEIDTSLPTLMRIERKNSWHELTLTNSEASVVINATTFRQAMLCAIQISTGVQNDRMLLLGQHEFPNIQEDVFVCDLATIGEFTLEVFSNVVTLNMFTVDYLLTGDKTLRIDVYDDANKSLWPFGLHANDGFTELDVETVITQKIQYPEFFRSQFSSEGSCVIVSLENNFAVEVPFEMAVFYIEYSMLTGNPPKTEGLFVFQLDQQQAGVNLYIPGHSPDSVEWNRLKDQYLEVIVSDRQDIIGLQEAKRSHLDDLVIGYHFAQKQLISISQTEYERERERYAILGAKEDWSISIEDTTVSISDGATTIESNWLTYSQAFSFLTNLCHDKSQDFIMPQMLASFVPTSPTEQFVSEFSVEDIHNHWHNAILSGLVSYFYLAIDLDDTSNSELILNLPKGVYQNPLFDHLDMPSGCWLNQYDDIDQMFPDLPMSSQQLSTVELNSIEDLLQTGIVEPKSTFGIPDVRMNNSQGQETTNVIPKKIRREWRGSKTSIRKLARNKKHTRFNNIDVLFTRGSISTPHSLWGSSAFHILMFASKKPIALGSKVAENRYLLEVFRLGKEPSVELVRRLLEKLNVKPISPTLRDGILNLAPKPVGPLTPRPDGTPPASVYIQTADPLSWISGPTVS